MVIDKGWKVVMQAFALLLLGMIAACNSGPKRTGILQGTVTIGPLVPVVGPGVEAPTPGPAVFAGRKVVISDTFESREVAIRDDGTYRVELDVGTYEVDINHLGIDHAAGLPARVEIRADQIAILDIDIDTGIR